MYIVQLNGTSLDRTFREFLIQARTVGDNCSVGSFIDGNSYKPTCTNDVCFKLHYIHFVCMVVCMQSTYVYTYVHIRT